MRPAFKHWLLSNLLFCAAMGLLWGVLWSLVAIIGVFRCELENVPGLILFSSWLLSCALILFVESLKFNYLERYQAKEKT